MNTANPSEPTVPELTFFDTSEAARITRHSAHWIRKQIKIGKLKAVRAGQRHLIAASELHSFLARSGSA